MAQPQPAGFTEYRVKLADVKSKRFHMMKFKHPHRIDLDKLTDPTLDRQAVHVEEDEKPLTGEGSEYGRKRREEARKMKIGRALRRADPDDQPWVLKEQKRGGKHFVGRKEGTVNTSSSYYILTLGPERTFEAYPIDNWYDFVPPVKYNYLNEEEAEERFERRNKTLNYFSIMLSKKLKNGEEGEEGGMTEAGEGSSGVKSKNKLKESDLGLVLTDSEMSSDDESDKEDDGPPKKSKKDPSKKLVEYKRKKKGYHSDSEAGEDTDEGELESHEVDYMSDTSSESEQELQMKQAIKEAPKDDEDVERFEEGEIDKGFTESSSSSEDELTEEGKEIKALIKKQSGARESSSDEGENPDAMEQSEIMAINVKAGDRPATPITSKKASKKDSSKQSPSKKRDVEQVDNVSTPPAKKQRTETTNIINEAEVKRYLSRKPITSKELVKKFLGKKTGMERNQIVTVLGQIIQRMKGVERQSIKGKLYLSLKPTQT